MSTLRAFLAVPLNPSLQRAVAALQRELAGALPGIRWTRPETVHLTLHFFGDIRTDALEKIRASMLSITLREVPFQVEVQGLGAFPDRRRPRVVWLGLVPEQGVCNLQRNCAAELAARGFPVGPRPFAPHLTIGRCRERGPELPGLPAAPAGKSLGQLPVERLVLYESRLLPGGAQHLELFSVPLGRNDPLSDLE